MNENLSHIDKKQRKAINKLSKKRLKGGKERRKNVRLVSEKIENVIKAKNPNDDDIFHIEENLGHSVGRTLYFPDKSNPHKHFHGQEVTTVEVNTGTEKNPNWVDFPTNKKNIPMSFGSTVPTEENEE